MGKEERRVQEVMSEENTWQHVCIDRDKPVKTSAPSHPSGNCGQFCRGCDRVAFLNRWLFKNAEIAQWSILGRNKTNRLLADGHVTPLSALLTLIGWPPPPKFASLLVQCSPYSAFSSSSGNSGIWSSSLWHSWSCPKPNLIHTWTHTLGHMCAHTNTRRDRLVYTVSSTHVESGVNNLALQIVGKNIHSLRQTHGHLSYKHWIAWTQCS